MSTKPDYEAAYQVMWTLPPSDEWTSDDLMRYVDQVVDAAFGDDPVAFAMNVLEAEGGEAIWYCEAWENRQGVNEPCEAGSTHDAPDFVCHWRLVFPIPTEKTR